MRDEQVRGALGAETILLPQLPNPPFKISHLGTSGKGSTAGLAQGFLDLLFRQPRLTSACVLPNQLQQAPPEFPRASRRAALLCLPKMPANSDLRPVFSVAEGAVGVSPRQPPGIEDPKTAHCTTTTTTRRPSHVC
uniref:Uncharacterized protein n=1 Tax=Bionectria ochroleuca TaxID=29856 RepID=A0A8H7NE65_BIOOC